MIPVGRHESQERSNSSLATWMSAREEVYRARAERVKSVCRKYSSSDHPVNDLEGNDSISVFVLSQSSHIFLSTKYHRRVGRGFFSQSSSPFTISKATHRIFDLPELIWSSITKDSPDPSQSERSWGLEACQSHWKMERKSQKEAVRLWRMVISFSLSLWAGALHFAWKSLNPPETAQSA